MTLRTQNETFGFYGTIAHAPVDRDKAWEAAMAAISRATGLDDDAAIRAFLDSRMGRHFADTVHNHLHRGMNLRGAVDAAVAEWMGRAIGRPTSRHTGIPADLPELTGWVGHFQIRIESDAQSKP